MHIQLTAVVVAAIAHATAAVAQPVYRCGDSYSQRPCPGGTVVQAEDERSAAQRAQTRQAAQRDAKTADAMEKARLKEEAKAAPALILAKPEQAAPKQLGKKGANDGKGKKPAHFTATAPKKAGDTPTAKKKNAV